MLHGEGHGDDIVTVSFDSRHDKLGFLLVKEGESERLGLVRSFLWEVCNQQGADETDNTGEESFHDELDKACKSLL